MRLLFLVPWPFSLANCRGQLCRPAGLLCGVALAVWALTAAHFAKAATIDNPVAPAKDSGLQARLDFAEQTFNYPKLIRDTLMPPQWVAGHDRFIYWAASGVERGTWVMVDASTGKRHPIIAATRLRAELRRFFTGSFLDIDNPPFILASPTQLIFTWHGRALALDWATGKVSALPDDNMLAMQLTAGALPSPQGQGIAVQRGHGFSLVDRKGRTSLEKTGTPDLAWQVPAQAWSPNGRHVVVAQSDQRKVHHIPVVDYTTPIERLDTIPYAKAGTPVAHTTFHAIEQATGATVALQMASEDAYAWLAGWRPDSSEALLLRLSRDGKRLDLLAGDPKSGRVRLLLREERLQTFVGALDFILEGWTQQIVPLADNQHFLWLSERDGWRHVYLYGYNGALIRQITRGNFPVHNVAGLSSDQQTIFAVASARSDAPYDRQLYAVSRKGDKWRLLTPEPGLHRIFLAPSARYFVHGYSTRTQPRRWQVTAADRSTSFRFAEADTSALARIHYTPPEGFTTYAADGTTLLYGVLYKPKDFDPALRYPIIDCIYAGPFITVVPWGFVSVAEGRVAAALAQLGFITVVLDARGTPGRGKAFQDVTYGRIGQIEILDHVAALRQVAATRPFIDLNRVGIVGHSWGGYFALRGMLSAPDFFKAGYAGAPGALFEDAAVNEPNLGLPRVNPLGYQAGANEPLAGNLKGVLRMMHGTSDVDASLSTTMRMAAALIDAHKFFELLIMPGQPHGLRGHAMAYYKEDVRRFFVRTLGGPLASDGVKQKHQILPSAGDH